MEVGVKEGGSSGRGCRFQLQRPFRTRHQNSAITLTAFLSDPPSQYKAVFLLFALEPWTFRSILRHGSSHNTF